MKRAGVVMGELDENKVIRTLQGLAGEGLAKEEAGGWVAIYQPGPKQVKQQELF